jgi:hypothetical protein
MDIPAGNPTMQEFALPGPTSLKTSLFQLESVFPTNISQIAPQAVYTMNQGND